jgi:hypothetical protein
MKMGLKFGIGLLLCSCASAPWQPVEPAKKVFQVPGFSFDLGDAQGWNVNTRMGAGHVNLVKKNNESDPYENYAIEAYTMPGPTFTSDDDFLAAAKKGQAITSDPRYKVIRNDMRLYKLKGEPCVLSQAVAEDDGNVPAFGFGIHRRPGAMMFEIVTLNCRETGNPGNILNLDFSLHYYPKERDAAFTDKAMKIVESVVIK